MKKIIPFLVIPLLGLVSFTIVTPAFLDKLEAAFDNYTKTYPEKIYIHTDKPIYSLDDDIWFSTYLVNGITHKKSQKSKVIHVELINDKDSIVASKKLFALNTSVPGDFKISKNWPVGMYMLRAYTNYMKNESADYFFQKQIPIYATNITDEKSDSKKKKTKKKEVEIQPEPTVIKQPQKKEELQVRFYPEGGYLINNIPNKIAFEFTSPKYDEVQIEGTIIDEEDNDIINFKTLKRGLGSFIFIPEKGKKYYASITINDREKRYILPTALEKGINLSVSNTPNHIIISENSNLENGLQNTYLVIHQRGELLFKKFEETSKKTNIIKIPTKTLIDGVVSITLFDADGNPIAERLTYVDNSNNNLEVNINKLSESYSLRKKVEFDVNVTNKQGTSVPSLLSLTVRDLKSSPYNSFKTGNIKTWLLLNSDLKGSIKNPGYFFENQNDPKRKYILDLVMLTNGWRRFTWPEVLNNQQKQLAHTPEVGLFISGTTKHLKKPYTPFSAPIRLTFLGKNIFQENERKSDTLGKFTFGPYIFFDSIPVLIESRKDKFKSTHRKSRNVVILVDNHKQSEIPQVSRNVVFNKREKQSEEKEAANFLKVTRYIQEEKARKNQEILELNEITLTAKRKTEEDKRKEDMNSLTEYGAPISGRRLDLLTDMPDAGSYTAFDIVAQMSGVSIEGDSIFIRRSNNNARILLDGLEIDGTFLRSINGDEISFIDILTGADAALFLGGGNGIVALYSNSGNVGSRSVKRKPGIIDFQAKGFYTARKFYAPDHVNDFELINQTDYRTTLHWNPLIRINQNNYSTISFFTGDIQSDYIIEIEGIADDGTPLHTYKTFQVE